MKLIIDNVERQNYNYFNYPNKDIKKIEINNVKHIFCRKDLKIEFDNQIEAEEFIQELMREYGITQLEEV